MTLSETEIDHRVFLSQAKRFNVETVLYYYTDGIHPLLYEKYYSDTIIVSNKAQFQNFVELGFPPERCNMVGSFNFSDGIPETVKPRINTRYGPRNILYFTKGTRAIDEGVLDELTEKLKSLELEYSLIIKKHPKDTNSFRRFAKKGCLVTDKADYMEFVKKSDLIISQYSGVINRIIPLRIPIILYTYSDMLEYGERRFFKNSQLPNYLRYVQNKEEFYDAIERLLDLGEPDPLPPRLAEDLYGHLDGDCGRRIAEVVSSFTV